MKRISRSLERHIAWVAPLGLALSVLPRVGAAKGANDNATLGEIVVTAERVHTNEQKTPVSMEVLSGTALAARGVVDIQTLAEADPSVNIDTGNGAGWITMRGISGSQGFGGAGLSGPSVPIATDGFFSDLNFTFNDSLYDVKRIEVLRGPQGTLFGRNSTGGLINVVTNDPTRKFGGYGQLTLGDYNLVAAEGALNLPINDKLQMRIAFFSAQHSGYRNLYYGLGGTADDQDAKSGRVKVAYEPTDHLRLLASFQVTHVGGAGTTDNIFVLPADANNLPTHVAIPLTQSVASVYNLAIPNTVNVDDKLTQWRLIYDALPYGMTFTYLGGIDQLTYLHSGPVLGLDAAPYGIPLTTELLTTLDPVTQNHEIRLTSAQNQAVTWQGGIFFFKANIGNNDSHFRDAATPSQPDIVSFLYNDEQHSIAPYGQLNWHLGPTTFSAGLRYNRDYITRTDLTSPGDGVFPARDSITYSKWTWHVGEDWNVTHRNMLYAKVDTGYSAGAYNLMVPCNCTGGPPQPTTIQPYAPEYVTTYEIGSKNKLFADHMLLNADVFYSRFRNQQLLESNQGGVVTVNAQVANIYGAELSYAAIGSLGRFDLNATWLHARFDSQLFTNALNQTYNIGGNRLTQSPELSLTASFEHSFPIGSGTLTPRVDTKFQTGQYYDFYNFPDSYQKSYTRTAVHLTYAPDAAHWSIDLWVRNLENAIVIADESESFAPPLSQPGTYNVGFQSPRTFGVTIRDQF